MGAVNSAPPVNSNVPGLRLTTTGTLTGPSAAEVGWDGAGSEAFLVGFDRGAASYRNTRVVGAVVRLMAGATVRVRLDGTGIGLYGAAPVAQAGAIAAPAAPSAAYVQAEAQAAVTAINAIRVALTNIGLTA